MATNGQSQERNIGFIDIGTNSIRLILVTLKPDNTYKVLREEKEVVRLGDSVFRNGALDEPTIQRAILVCKKLVEVANGFNATILYTAATSAVREARNQRQFLTRLYKETKLETRIISGKEEARLIYLGVSSGVHLDGKRALFIDIGGGSTELIIGDQERSYALDSLELGAIRLTRLFLPKKKNQGRISKQTYAKLCHYIRAKVIRSKERTPFHHFDLAVGSSGTIINLAEIANKLQKHNQSPHDLTLHQKDLKKVIETLLTSTLEERAQLPGINPERADIIIAGAAIIDCIMDVYNIKTLRISYRDMRYGMLNDYLNRRDTTEPKRTTNVREGSVVRLGRSFNIDEEHAHTVTTIALRLFDETKNLSLHHLTVRERELLQYTAYLHDIGNFISFKNHHLHSHYIISNADLLGFDQQDITIMADTARFHRKKFPRRKDPVLASLDKQTQNTIFILSTLLRLAEKLDRSHTTLIQDVSLSRIDEGTILLTLHCPNNTCELEYWGIESERSAFEKTFNQKLKIEVPGTKPISLNRSPLIQ